MTASIHGFVLAGGRSSRMGRDKALLQFHGAPMVQCAVTTLSQLCEHVGISGNREDLAGYGPVVREMRVGAGPIAGIEAGLQASESEWALFLPVDVPLLPASFLAAWACAVLARPAVRASHVSCNGNPHPAICLLRQECLADVYASVEAGERSVQRVLHALEGFWMAEAAEFAEPTAIELWFMNVNTPEQLASAERSGNGERPIHLQNRIIESMES